MADVESEDGVKIRANPNAKLLTRDDLEHLTGNVPVWEEMYDPGLGTELRPAIVTGGQMLTIDGEFYDMDSEWLFHGVDYQFRYWDSKPTKERMDEEPWHD